MSDGKKWVKWWADAANDPKVLSIPYQCRWALPALLLLAKKSRREGYLEMTPGKPYSEEDLSKWCDMPLVDIRNACNAMVKSGILTTVTECNVTIYKFERWDNRQKSTSYERVKRFRERAVTKRNADVTKCNVSTALQCNAPVTLDVDLKDLDLKDLDLKKDRSTPIVPRPGNGRFTPPTLDEITEYCQLRNNAVDPVKFHAFYTSNGWKVGRNPMRKWKAAIVTWEKN